MNSYPCCSFHIILSKSELFFFSPRLIFCIWVHPLHTIMTHLSAWGGGGAVMVVIVEGLDLQLPLLPPLTLRVQIQLMARCTSLCDQVCQWLVAGLWFSQGTSVSSTNKTDRHDVTEILLKVPLNTITHLSAWPLTSRLNYLVFLASTFVQVRTLDSWYLTCR